MKKNLNVELLDFKGKPVTEKDKKIIIKDVVINALMSVDPQKNIDGTEKFNRYKLAQKIDTKPENCELSSEDIVKIKEVVGQGYGPLVVGFVFNLLESN